MNHRLKLLSTLVIILAAGVFSFTACGGGSSGSFGDDLTEAENNDRVGRTVIRCGVDEVDDAVVQAVNEMFSETGSSRSVSLLETAREPGSIEIPVVAHVISTGPSEAQGNISDAAIAEQMRVLNEGFAGAGGSAPTAYRFTLVETTRTINPFWATMEFGSAAEREAKQALRRGNAQTMNMYLVQPPSGTLGWASLPWQFSEDPVLDGIVVSFETVPGGSFAPYNAGKTAVHEAGHWFGLFHTFQGRCSGVSDGIGDTPPEDRPAFGCPVGRNTCPQDARTDPVNNFMDYSDDFCLVEFTPGQAERMLMSGVVFRGL